MYTPAANFNGRDSLYYRACDGAGACDTALAVFVVAAAPDAPVAVDDTYNIDEDVPVTINAPGLLSNDTDADGDPLTASLYTPPANGTMTINPNGSFTYTPNSDYNGTDAFVYRVCDNGDPSQCDTATVRINISPVNDAPRAADDNYSVREDNTLTVPAAGVLLNDREPDGQAMTATLIIPAANGVTTLGANGALTFTPNANFNGIDSVTYRVCDGSGLCDTAVVRVVITPENDAPTAVNDSYSLQEDIPLVITQASLTANDTDPDGDALTVSNFTQPANGTLTVTTGPGGVPALAYRPRTNFNGPDQFTYTACDQNGACSTATVSLTVQPVDDPLSQTTTNMKPGRIRR